jgi:hypothetical protein
MFVPGFGRPASPVRLDISKHSCANQSRVVGAVKLSRVGKDSFKFILLQEKEKGTELLYIIRFHRTVIGVLIRTKKVPKF